MKNRRDSAFLISFLLVVSAAMAVSAQTAASVGLYQGPGAKGTPQEIAPGIYAVKAGVMGAPEGKTTGFSVRVPAGLMIRFCENAGTGNEGGGTCEEFGEGAHDLRSQAEVNYIRVWKPGAATAAVPAASPGPVRPAEPIGVVVYEAPSLQGLSQGFGPGMYRSFKGEFGKILDNKAVSAVIAKGYRVRFCVDEGIWNRGAGDCEEHDAGRVDNLRFADSISFIEVIDLNDPRPKEDTFPVVLYEDGDQGGKMQGFDVGMFLARAGEFRKLGGASPSSIRVKKGYRATVCSDESAPPESCEEFGPGKFNLRKRPVAIYIKVLKTDK
jgi:hypothetical protein